MCLNGSRKQARTLLRVAITEMDFELIQSLLLQYAHFLNTGPCKILLQTARRLLGVLKKSWENLSKLTPLHRSCQMGFQDLALFYLDQGANIEARDETERTPLHHATIYGNIGIVSLLLDRGADTTPTDLKGYIPVHYACQKQNLEMAKVFFKHATDFKRTEKVTLFHVACAFGITKVFLCLLQKFPTIVNLVADYDKTPLHLASDFGHLPIVQLLLSKGADMERKDREGWTSLHLAAGKGHKEVAKLLLDKGADIEAKQRHGWTPLQVACQNNQLEMVRLLVARGANIRTRGNGGWTPLHIACKFGGLEVARCLSNTEMIRYVFGETTDADLNPTTAKGFTPLHIACIHGQLDLLPLLVDQGADITARANGKATPIQLAQNHNHTEIVQLLTSWM